MPEPEEEEAERVGHRKPTESRYRAWLYTDRAARIGSIVIAACTLYKTLRGH